MTFFSAIRNFFKGVPLIYLAIFLGLFFATDVCFQLAQGTDILSAMGQSICDRWLYYLVATVTYIAVSKLKRPPK